MVDKATFSIPILVLITLTFQNIVCEEIPIDGRTFKVTDLGTKVDRLEHMIKIMQTNEQTMLEKLSTQENTILEMQKKNEDLQRMAESHAKLIEDQKLVIEHVNASFRSNDKYGCSNSDVVFAANIHLGAEYLLPVGAPITSYNQIPINVGNHFNSYMGTFEAPHSGTYEFWFDAKIIGLKWAVIDLRVNGEVVKEFSTGIYNAGTTAGRYGFDGNAVISLSAYDIVDLFVPDTTDPNIMHAICGHVVQYFMFAGRSL